MQVIPFERLTRPVSQRFLTFVLSAGISMFTGWYDVRAQSCSTTGQTLGAYVQYQTVYTNLSKCCYPEYTNLDLPRIHMYHNQHIVGNYVSEFKNDFTEATNWSGGSGGSEWDYHAGAYSEHDNTTRNFDFTEMKYVLVEQTNYCFYTNSCTGDLSTDNVMTDSRFHSESSSADDGQQSDSRSVSSFVSGTIITNDCCTAGGLPCNPNGNDVAYGFIGSWGGIGHTYNLIDFGFTHDQYDDFATSSTNTDVQLSCLTVHRALTQIDSPTNAESDFSVTNTTLPPLCPSCSSDAFVDSTHDVFNYTLSYEYTDEELSNHIVGLMGDFSGSWYTPGGYGNDFYSTTAYSMIDGDHVRGYWQPKQNLYSDGAEMQKMKYRIVIPNTEAAKRYNVSWDLITYDFTLGYMDIASHSVIIEGTGGSDPIYTAEDTVVPPYWDGSRDFFGGVVATWVDNLVISELPEGTAGAGPGSLSWSALASGCATCGSARSALQRSPYGALNASFPLGNALGYGSAGNLEISARIPDVNLATPSSLIYPDGIPSTEAIRQYGALRQINAPQSLVDIVTLNAFSYQLRYYLPSQVGGVSGGVYSVTGSPFVTWTIQNPDASTNTYNRLQITETRGSDTHVYLYTYNSTNPSNSVWTLNRPDNAQEEFSTGFSGDADWLTLNVTNTVRNPSGTTEFQEIRIYQRPTGIQPASIDGTTNNRAQLTWNPQMKFYLTTNIVNPGSNAKVTTYSYYTNDLGAYAWGPWFHSTIPPVQYIKRSDGSWDYFTYNEQNVTDHVTPFGDVAPPTSGAPSYSTSRHTMYFNFDGSDFLTYPGSIKREDKGNETEFMEQTTNLW